MDWDDSEWMLPFEETKEEKGKKTDSGRSDVPEFEEDLEEDILKRRSLNAGRFKTLDNLDNF
jgi:hypothetical protein